MARMGGRGRPNRVRTARRPTPSGCAEPAARRAAAWGQVRPADQLDYMIRRWLIPVSFEPNRLIATDSSFRWSYKHSRGASESKHPPAPLRRGIGFLSEVRAVI